MSSCCCSVNPPSRKGDIARALLALLAAILFTDSAMHSAGKNGEVSLLRWFLAGIWWLVVLLWAWRVCRRGRKRCASACVQNKLPEKSTDPLSR
ncbi:hypothetical protein ACOBR2_16895 [Telmatobacter bradus]|uniref:hypothetical protein n=1 Tax=Telmatobacter bradus TaxID=474953 RepID=UPI003B43A9D3